MMIEFQKVFYKNFMSVGNMGLTIELDRSTTTLIGGQNGAGKSTLLEAISYGLFGKPLKKINLPGMVNSINKGKMEVRLEFAIQGKQYKIVRGEKPKKLEFYIDGELLDQTAAARDYQAKIEYILGMDYKLFTQIAILNKERYVPFMELDAEGRRKVVEDILDISVFSSMSKLAKEEAKGVSNELKTLQFERTRIEQSIKGQERLIAEAESNLDDKRDRVQNALDELIARVSQLDADIEGRRDSLTALTQARKAVEEKTTRKAEFDKIAVQLKVKMSNLDEKLSFLCDNDDCPTCKQVIASEFKDQEIGRLNAEKDKVKSNAGLFESEYRKALTALKEASTALEEVSETVRELRGLEREKSYLESDIEIKEKELASFKKDDKLDEYKEELQQLFFSLDDNSENLKGCMDKEEVFAKIVEMLKDDGIKSSIVKDYIGFINIRLNEYLNAMNFYVSIQMDENFKEKIHSINKENFTYDNFSTGQKTRINLAVWLALLEVASMKNSAVTNMVFLDEILEPFDSNGVQDFMKLAKEKLPHKNLFVITQRYDEFFDYFRSSFKFTLKDGFTEIMA